MWQRTTRILEGGVVSGLFRWGKAEEPLIHDYIERDTGLLFTLVGMELWGRIYLAGESPESLGETVLSIAGFRPATSAMTASRSAAGRPSECEKTTRTTPT